MSERYILESDPKFEEKVDELEPKNVCKNKFSKLWFNEENTEGETFRVWLRKLNKVGKAKCLACQAAGVINYGSAGKKALLQQS